MRDSTAAVGRGNGVNNVLFSPTVYGTAWDGRTLGITLQTFDVRTRRYSETDVLFNSTVKWDSYRGPVRTAAGGGNLNDFRRVAIHEFGHALGLNHPDEISQSVVAIMNSVTGDVDALAADDIAGARAIYDNPNVVPTAILSFQGAIGYSTNGNALTMIVGAIRNDGDARRARFGSNSGRRAAFHQHPARRVRNLGIHTLIQRSLRPPPSATSTPPPPTPPPNGSYFVYLLTESTGTT